MIVFGTGPYCAKHLIFIILTFLQNTEIRTLPILEETWAYREVSK